MNRNENEEEKAGKGVWPPCQELLATLRHNTQAGTGFAKARGPLPAKEGDVLNIASRGGRDI